MTPAYATHSIICPRTGETDPANCVRPEHKSIEAQMMADGARRQAEINNAFFALIGGFVFFIILVIIIALIIRRVLRSRRNRNPKQQQTLKPQNIGCGNCNTIVDYSNKFCKKCGASL